MMGEMLREKERHEQAIGDSKTEYNKEVGRLID
jgi:hypothetical protein